jgi:hypothetical protein
MADFFTRLAERTLGLAPTVQPMIASIYEPDPELVTSEPFEMALEEESPDVGAPGRVFSRASPGEGTQLIVPSASSPVQPAALVVPPRAGERQGWLRPLAGRKSARPPAQGIEEPSARTQEESLTITGLPATQLPAQSTIEHHIDEHSTGTFQNVSISFIAPPIQTFTPPGSFNDARMNDTQQIDVHMHTDNIVGMPLEGTQGRKEAVPSTKVVTRGTQRRDEAISATKASMQGGPTGTSMPQDAGASFITPPIASQLTSSSGNEKQSISERPSRVPEVPTLTQTPTVQVTIGRVEVRATPAPAQSASDGGARTSTSPVMSLDDYLQQRARGGHR